MQQRNRRWGLVMVEEEKRKEKRKQGRGGMGRVGWKGKGNKENKMWGEEEASPSPSKIPGTKGVTWTKEQPRCFLLSYY